jgi:predicted RNA-binding Zn ribbon-like protein
MKVLFPSPIGGSLALDFVNTLDPWYAAEQRDRFSTFADVIDFVADLDAVPEPVRVQLLTDTPPAVAASALAQIRLTRHALYRVLAAAYARASVPEDALAEVNTALQAATAAHLLQPHLAGGVRDGWNWGTEPTQVLWPIVIDAWDILTGPLLARLKQCPGDNGACGWLFLDTSRNGTRRWCDMRTCGNRAKVRAYLGRRISGG